MTQQLRSLAASGSPLGPGIAFRPEGPLSVIAVVHRLKPCRWHAEAHRNILFRGGLPLLGAEDRAIDVVGWLRRLELEHAITGRASSGETLFDS